VTRRPVFKGDVPFSDKEKTRRQIVPFFNSAVFYNWYRFFIMACKQQLELRCLEWKSPSCFNKPLHVLLSALIWFVNLDVGSNRAFCMSAVRERLQLMYRGWVTNKFKQWDNLSRRIKIEVSTQNCINKAKYNLNLWFTPYYIIMVHGIFVQIIIWIPYLGYYWQSYFLIVLLTSFIVGE
jgi:hypothetical protein